MRLVPGRRGGTVLLQRGRPVTIITNLPYKLVEKHKLDPEDIADKLEVIKEAESYVLARLAKPIKISEDWKTTESEHVSRTLVVEKVLVLQGRRAPANATQRGMLRQLPSRRPASREECIRPLFSVPPRMAEG